MQVILLKEVKRLGNTGDVVKVKDGYGANYLIPRKLARPVAGKKAHKVLEDEKKKSALRIKKQKQKFEEFAKRLEEKSCTVSAQAGEDGKLFGTITTEMVRDAYAAEGIELDKKQIQLEEHINKLGVYTAKIKLHPEVTAEIKLWVVKK